MLESVDLSTLSLCCFGIVDERQGMPRRAAFICFWRDFETEAYDR